MTDLVPVITSLDDTPAVVVDRDERTIRLGDLGIAPENLRFNEPSDDDIPTLAATIRAAGQLQRLTVRPGRGKKEQPWMALDGRRRRLALDLLREAGAIDEDYPVTVYVETDPARQSASTLRREPPKNRALSPRRTEKTWSAIRSRASSPPSTSRSSPDRPLSTGSM
jgi:ParB family transcriptional regulator, chromosome partitioning protein